jgi:hypothetical protein
MQIIRFLMVHGKKALQARAEEARHVAVITCIARPVPVGERLEAELNDSAVNDPVGISVRGTPPSTYSFFLPPPSSSSYTLLTHSHVHVHTYTPLPPHDS